MTPRELIAELKEYLPVELAEDLVSQFMSIRTDVATETLERAAPGKFVETVVQVLQYLASGTYSKSFRSGEVENFLKYQTPQFLRDLLHLTVEPTLSAFCFLLCPLAL